MLTKTQKSKLLKESKKGSAAGIDPKQLAAGIKVELEHTTDRRIAKKIATDHLQEHGDYYKELKKMEAKLKKRGK